MRTISVTGGCPLPLSNALQLRGDGDRGNGVAKRYYGQEPENSVEFNFDESGVSFIERALVKLFTTQAFGEIRARKDAS